MSRGGLNRGHCGLNRGYKSRDRALGTRVTGSKQGRVARGTQL